MTDWDQKQYKTSKRRRGSVNTKEIIKIPKLPTLQAIIVDNGAHTIKIGHSLDSEPQIVPNCIMKAKSERKRLFIGKQIEECRDCSGLYYLLPCEKGYITKWEVQKPVWDQIFNRNYIDDNPIIITQPLFNFKSIQDCMDEIYFEEYEVTSLFRTTPTDLAYLHYAKQNKLMRSDSCLVVDCGYSFTHIIPYIRGNKFLRGIRRLNVGGKLLTNHLKDIISYRQYNVMEETYVINQVKEDTGYVCMNVKNELKTSKTINYVLPDFNSIRRGFILGDDEKNHSNNHDQQILRLNNERYIVPEILFHPSDIGMRNMGISEAIVKAIKSCPENEQKILAKNVILVGGSCKFSGFKERIYADVRSLLPDTWTLNIFLPEDPISYTWKGGSALLMTYDFRNNLVTKKDYDELGSTIIQERFNTFMLDDSQIEDCNNSSVLAEEICKNDEESFKYLPRLKSGSIFGKQEDNNEDIIQIKVDNDDGGEMHSNSGLSSEKDDAAEENEIVENKRGLGRPPKLKNNVESIEIIEEIDDDDDDSEDDLTQSVELFPLGTNSYL